MKNIQQLLRDKEQRIQQLRHEIEALRIVAPMMADAAEPKRAAAAAAASSAASEKGDLDLYLDDPVK